MKNIIKEIAIIIGLSVITAILVNRFSPNGIAYMGEWNTEKGTVTARPKNDFIVHDLEIQSVAEVRKIFEKGDALFVDARDMELYEQGHIPGAVSLPVRNYFDDVEKFMEKYPVSTRIITYCSGRECGDSHELTQYLIEEGYKNIRVYIDGYTGWKNSGYTVEQ